MEKRNLKKMIFGGLLLISALQITFHFVQVSDLIYGGATGIAFGIMIIGLLKMIKPRKPSSTS
ncbi:MAG: hypothetical protein HRT66_05240 [Flavobacteriaceae bacterium]|nr:hypothetical protein [Flavobacteriaceae bacterium]